MLPADQRLTSSAAFRAVVRQGQRRGGSSLVVHLLLPSTEQSGSPRVGLVVSKAVGNAVTRNRVKRRLRHLAREHVATLPEGAQVVVRALPPAAGATYADLGAELQRCLTQALDRAGAAA